jgi:hypothetical protein
VDTRLIAGIVHVYQALAASIKSPARRLELRTTLKALANRYKQYSDESKAELERVMREFKNSPSPYGT